MKALNLSIYTGENNTHKVTMTAEFDSHEDAVRFHEGVAKLCRDSSHHGHLPGPRWQRFIGGPNSGG